LRKGRGEESKCLKCFWRDACEYRPEQGWQLGFPKKKASLDSMFGRECLRHSSGFLLLLLDRPFGTPLDELSRSRLNRPGCPEVRSVAEDAHPTFRPLIPPRAQTPDSPSKQVAKRSFEFPAGQGCRFPSLTHIGHGSSLRTNFAIS
jgi:hypothetical protein